MFGLDESLCKNLIIKTIFGNIRKISRIVARLKNVTRYLEAKIRNVGNEVVERGSRPTFHLFAGPWRINLPRNCVRLFVNE